MVSRSSLAIQWITPDIGEEQWEFFNHPLKQEWYRLHGITWEQIVSRSASGMLVPYPRSDLLGELPVKHSYYSYDDFLKYLSRAKRGYRKSYSSMESELQKSGELILKAPVILGHDREGLLFSGYRRLCLAWNYGMIPYVWFIALDDRIPVLPPVTVIPTVNYSH